MDKKKILAVDDQPENLRLIMEILKEDYTIIVATNAEKGLELAAREPQPEVVLIDVRMPEMDGFEMAQRLRNEEQTASIPFIFVTAADQEEDFQKGLALGADEFISKPISPVLLKHRLLKALKG